MNKKFHFESISYNALLRSEGLHFKEDDKWLSVGLIEETCGFILYVSCRTSQTPLLLKHCLPLLKKTSSVFRLIKNQNLQYRLNSGGFGDNEAGKVITIFPKTIDELKLLRPQLAAIVTEFKGPIVPDAQQIDHLYTYKKLN